MENKKKIERKIVQSFTISKELLIETKKCLKKDNFSEYTCKALEEYNKKAKKWNIT